MYLEMVLTRATAQPVPGQMPQAQPQELPNLLWNLSSRQAPMLHRL